MKNTVNLLCAIAFLMTSIPGFARYLNADEALQNALSSASSRHGMQSIAAKASGYAHVYTFNGKQAKDATVYVYANTTGSGFLVLSGSDRVTPILGYSDQGNFDAANVNPEFAYWLECYSKQIEAAENGAEIVLANAPATRSNISPLIQTQWNQSDPYNQECPIVAGGRSVTGCVATAFAQVMNYHKWPKTAGTGSHSYSWTVNGTTYTESMDFSTVQFDWNNMLNNYTSSASAAQKNAVAKLMHAVGVAAEMNYTPNSSGAVTNKAAQGLLTYWNYDQGAVGYARNCFSLDDWSSMIYDELSAARPVIYDGQSAGGGHCFICDGYNASNGYFHFNWGWGGYCDGYYALTDLTPARGGIGGTTSTDGYNTDQGIVIGLQPAQAGSTPRYAFQLTQSLSVDQNVYDKLQFIYINGQFTNGSLVDLNFVHGIKLVDVTDPSRVIYSVYTPYSYDYWEVPPGSYYPRMPFHGLVIPAGSYDMYFVYRTSEEDEWHDFLSGPGITDHLRIEANSDYIAFNGAELPAQSKHFKMLADLVPDETLFRRGTGKYSSIQFTGKFWNQTGNTVNFYPGIKFTSTDNPNEYYYQVYEINMSLPPQYSYSSWYGSSSYDIPNGSYILTPAYYDRDKEIWLDFDRNESYKDYCTAEIDSEYIALDGTPLPGEPLRVTNVTVTPTTTSDIDGEGTLHYYIGHKYTVTYTIESTGQGASGWYNTIAPYCVDSEEKETALGSVSLSETSTYPYTLSKTFTIGADTDPQDMSLVLWRMYSSKRLTNLNTLEFTTEYDPTMSYLRIDECTMVGDFSEGTTGASSSSPLELCKDYGMLSLTTHCESQPYSKALKLMIWGNTSGSSYSSEAYANFTLQCGLGEQKRVIVYIVNKAPTQNAPRFAGSDDNTLHVPLSYYSGRTALDSNKLYWLQFTDNSSNKIIPDIYFTISDSVLTGVPEITIVDPSEIRYFDLMGREVKNPGNGIYIRVWGGKTDKVVIK